MKNLSWMAGVRLFVRPEVKLSSEPVFLIIQ
jgi:hypothetical protein